MTRSITRALAAAAALVLTLAVAASATAHAPKTLTVRLVPAGGSAVAGTAVLAAEGTGTKVSLELRGLKRGSAARVFLHAGTVARPSASAALLATLKANAAGRATAAGRVLFRGSESVSLTTLADGAHVILVRTGKRVLAYGKVPRA